MHCVKEEPLCCTDRLLLTEKKLTFVFICADYGNSAEKMRWSRKKEAKHERRSMAHICFCLRSTHVLFSLLLFLIMVITHWILIFYLPIFVFFYLLILTPIFPFFINFSLFPLIDYLPNFFSFRVSSWSRGRRGCCGVGSVSGTVCTC